MTSGTRGQLIVVTGRTRSGKTYWVLQQIARDGNCLVWDSMGEFSQRRDFRKVTNPLVLHAIATDGLPGRYAVVFPVDEKHFACFCKLAWVWIRAAHKRGRRVTLVIEELADVTSPGKAPAAWGEIVRKSLRFDPTVYALTQRPTESDKTALGNATRLHCHAMARAEDRRMIARELDVDQTYVDGLKKARYQWVERNHDTGKVTAGGVGKAPPTPK